MTTPIYQTKTWQYAINANPRTPASIADAAAYQAWWIGAFLLGNIPLRDFDDNAIAGGSVQGKWTIYKTCNSLVADTADNLHLGGSYTAGDWVRGGSGVVHSWMVLKSPVSMQDGPFYILIDFSPGSAYQVSVSMSQSAFSTGGTTTDAPTAANAVTAATRQLALNGTQTPGRMRGTLCTDGNFVIQHSIDGSAGFDFFFAGCTLAETMEPEETHNFWLLWDYESTAPGQPGAPHIQNWQSFTTGPVMGRGPTGADLSGVGTTIIIPYAGGSPFYTNVVTGRDTTNNKFRNKQIIVTSNSPIGSERGTLVDISFCSGGLSAWLPGDFVPDSGTGQFREFMRAGMFLVPANGVAHTL